MTEEEGQVWVATRYPSKVGAITTFLDLIRDENGRQNLVAPSTISHLWVRHVVDSLQLLNWAPQAGLWTDIGTGGGFPGVIVAIARSAPIRMIEPRQKRAAFLRRTIVELQLHHADVIQARGEDVTGDTEVISARAVANVETLISIGRSWSTSTTRWILPRGRLSTLDMMTLTNRFGSRFHVEQSVTAPESSIVIASGRPS